MEEYLGAAYAKEFDLNVAIARPYNAYGPRDDFRVDRCPVIPALINKAMNAKDGRFKVWGDGLATRSFLFVDDFARGLLEITARHPFAEALNLGADAIHTIRELALFIGEITTEVRGEAIEPEFGDEGPTGSNPARMRHVEASRRLGLPLQRFFARRPRKNHQLVC